MIAKQPSSMSGNFQKHSATASQLDNEPMLFNTNRSESNLMGRASTGKNLVLPKEPFKPVIAAINPQTIQPIYLVATHPNTHPPVVPFYANQSAAQQPIFSPFMAPINYATMPQPQYYYFYPPTGQVMPNNNNKVLSAVSMPAIGTNQSASQPPPPPIASSARQSGREYPLALPVGGESNELPTSLGHHRPSDAGPLMPPKSREATVLYRYQKPITVDGLKHPTDKYKDLIYKPRYITSRNIEPPTEELVPKVEDMDNDNEDVLAPLMSFRTKYKSTLGDSLKLPVPKLTRARSHEPLSEPLLRPLVRKPTLVDELKLPIEKVTDHANGPHIIAKFPKFKLFSSLLKKPIPKIEPEIVKKEPEVEETPRFLESADQKPNYVGKFHYPPEIDDNPDVRLQKGKASDSETTKNENFHRPKSSIVNRR
jgi:hypothetical protein